VAPVEETKPQEAVAQEIVAQKAEVVETNVEQAPVEQTVAQETVVQATSEVTAAQPVQPVVAHVIKHATAPMTRAPAPEYTPEAPHHSDWVRPTYDFAGRGSAGASSATHQAAAPATRPQSTE
jgi:ribonuclease E